jgi:hypothetical protein
LFEFGRDLPYLRICLPSAVSVTAVFSVGANHQVTGVVGAAAAGANRRGLVLLEGGLKASPKDS